MKLRMVIIVPPTESAPSSIVNMFCSAPDRPMNSRQMPMAFVSVSEMRCGIAFFSSSPSRPPTTMAPALMIVPSPIKMIPSSGG